MGELNQKTVFLLDHCVAMKEPSGLSIEIDTGNRSRMQQHNSMGYFPFIPPVMKSLWTHVVESTLEYARVIWDIFSEERLLRIVFSDPQNAYAVNTWDTSNQNITFLSQALAAAGPPVKAGGTILVGIKTAIEALSQPSQTQISMSSSNASSYQIINRGRVICVTSCTTDSDLEDFFLSTLIQQNRIASASDHLLPIHECEFVLLSIHPMGKERLARVLSRPLHDLSSILRSEVYVVNPEQICDKLVELCARHHNLVTTTVTGIPMKEEMNSTSSNNYDVHLHHPKMPTCSESSTLKWSTPTAPKGSGLGTVHPCNYSVRITPVDVNSRPSTCLSNFVISGRSVWLESHKKTKTTSHVLTSHGGEMWMHIMETARNILEDPPSISEGIGGRVTDYRIPDFVEFMKLNMLIPFPNTNDKKTGKSLMGSRRTSVDDTIKTPLEIAKARLIRKTSFWPMTIGGSLLFPMQVHIDNLIRLLPKDVLTDADVHECDKTIWALMSIEARGESPPLPSLHNKKGVKRDEQWKAVYGEMETYIRANLNSDNHKRVLECFLDSRRRDDKTMSVKDDAVAKIKDSSLSAALGELANLAAPVVTTDSPMSPPAMPESSHSTKTKKKSTGKINLLSLWLQKTEKSDCKSLPSNGAKLYAQLEEKDKEKQKLLT